MIWREAGVLCAAFGYQFTDGGSDYVLSRETESGVAVLFESEQYVNARKPTSLYKP